MPKQVLEFYDYLGPLAVAAIFATVLLLCSFFIFNFLLVRKTDDFTVFERLGAKHNIRLGPHSLKQVQLCGRDKRFKYTQPDDAENTLKPTTKQKIPIVKVDAASNS